MQITHEQGNVRKGGREGGGEGEGEGKGGSGVCGWYVKL